MKKNVPFVALLSLNLSGMINYSGIHQKIFDFRQSEAKLHSSVASNTNHFGTKIYLFNVPTPLFYSPRYLQIRT